MRKKRRNNEPILRNLFLRYHERKCFWIFLAASTEGKRSEWVNNNVAGSYHARRLANSCNDSVTARNEDDGSFYAQKSPSVGMEVSKLVPVVYRQGS